MKKTLLGLLALSAIAMGAASSPIPNALESSATIPVETRIVINTGGIIIVPEGGGINGGTVLLDHGTKTIAEIGSTGSLAEERIVVGRSIDIDTNGNVDEADISKLADSSTVTISLKSDTANGNNLRLKEGTATIPHTLTATISGTGTTVTTTATAAGEAGKIYTVGEAEIPTISLISEITTVSSTQIGGTYVNNSTLEVSVIVP